MEFVTKDLGIPIYYKFKLLKCNHNKHINKHLSLISRKLLMFTDALFEVVKRRERQMNRQLQL